MTEKPVIKCPALAPRSANGLILTVLIVIIVRTVPLTLFLLRLDESVVIHTSSQGANAACVLPPPSSLMGRCSFSFLIACNEMPAREVICSYLDLRQDEWLETKERRWRKRGGICKEFLFCSSSEAGVQAELQYRPADSRGSCAEPCSAAS